MSPYEKDLETDRILSIYLDKTYKLLGLPVEREKDIGLQHLGVDINLTENGRQIPIDEKSQTHYFDRDLGTFAFEIGYFNKHGIHKKGWLFDEHKITEVYFLVVAIYIDGKELTDPEQVTSCKILRIKRQDLITRLKEWGLDQDTCITTEHRIRNGNEIHRIPISPSEDRLWYYYSVEFPEQPVNLVIRLKELKDIIEQIYPVTAQNNS